MEQEHTREMTYTEELESALVSVLRYLPKDCVIIDDVKALLGRHGWEFTTIDKLGKSDG